MLTLEDVKNKVYEMGELVGLDKDSSLYPLFSKTPDVFSDGNSIYIDREYHYIIMERGSINKHYQSEKLEDILCRVFCNITFTLAKDYELNNRRENEDFRRQLWSKQLELLGKINVNFQKNRSEEIDKILAISPFTDE